MGATGGTNFNESFGGRDPQNCSPYTNIWAQDTTQRQDENHSSHSKDDQLIEGGVWTAQLQESSEVTKEVGDSAVCTEGQLDQEEGVQQGMDTTEEPGPYY